MRRLVRSWRASRASTSGVAISMRKKVEPALRTVTRWREITPAIRSGGEVGEPSRSTEGTRHSSGAAIMYDCPVIHPAVATTQMRSDSGRRSKTSLTVAHSPTW
eukprot:scaffold27220_cov63-Phaeocystis_antarctica.AAC.3